ncbi:ral guanine nucleotide dissociation stimulator-like isoform X1 [Neofelis nebulosa]|uniref:ral guanine nucleotide dissociation stimulator-like isoform X1 n=1 Tax=Neofelis nebulosa TaxID=61452 RepID=UPI00272C6968|nr:ral guanine nucleotide dissociation stimulator-like isoform X1 [Neofelis nebulosa]
MGRPLAHLKYENAIYGKPSCENDPALPLDETQRVWTASADTLRQLGDPGQCSLLCPRLPAHLPKERHHPRGPRPAAQKGYGRCDALMASSRYRCILPYSDEDGGPQDQLKNAISPILGTWLDPYLEDFCQPPDGSVSHLEAAGGEGRTLKTAGQGCDASGPAAGRCLCRANSGDRQKAGQRGRLLPLLD